MSPSALQRIKRYDEARPGFPAEHWVTLAAGVGIHMPQHPMFSRISLDCRPAWLRFCAGLLLLAVAAFGAAAQVHEVRRGDLVLRSSTVASDRINPATASRHGIEPSPTRGVLNVVLLRGRDGRTIPAEVTASSTNLAGVRQDIDMREVRAAGRISYMGTYDFLPREVIDFEISARPHRPAGSRPLSLKYRDRMWAR